MFSPNNCGRRLAVESSGACAKQGDCTALTPTSTNDAIAVNLITPNYFAPSINCHASKETGSVLCATSVSITGPRLTVSTQIASQDWDRPVPERDCREATIIRPVN